MRVNEVRDLSDDDLQRELANAQREIMNLRFRHATKQLTNTSEMGMARKTVARLMLVTREREIQRTNR
ncbi:50S ribosomal protein L29 [SAR202 cluster bacterium AD-804-J14_MRT_500m]|nr:50S ribosomal protein L29 [SAR202 cluster bacterium AD-804-J14_MRT_500m]